MTISSLRITNFRNLTAVELAPCLQGLNIICGNNGSGKTSLLEAIYYLGLGRSFRSSTFSRLIQQETDKLSIFSQVMSESLCHIPLGVERDLNGNTRLRVAGKEASSITELALHLPLRLINSQSYQIFEAGPTFRRKYLDWGLFYQFDNFMTCWRQFERALKQRNAVLKEKRSNNELKAWTEEFVKQALELDAFRQKYIALLAPFILELTQELLGISNLEFKYYKGWDSSKDLLSVLTHSYPDEIRYGHAQYGPHRADLNISLEGVPVKHFLSRGQQKLLICAMIIGQGRLLASQINKRLIYLVDDLPAELDLLSRQKLMALLCKQNAQIFITAIESNAVCDVIDDSHRSEVPIKVFHVKHGSLFE